MPHSKDQRYSTFHTHSTSPNPNEHCSFENIIPNRFWRLNSIFPFFFEQNSNIPFHIFHVSGPKTLDMSSGPG
jgi:hypothetical protein